MYQIPALVFSFFGAFCLTLSTFSKDKKKMLWIQVADTGFNALGNLFAGSFSGMSTNLISLVRNIINAKGKMSLWLASVFAAGIFTVGLIINKIGWIGLLPPIASVEYTIISAIGKTAQTLRIALGINTLLWLLHDAYIGLYPSVVADVVVLSATVVNIYRFKKIKKE